MSAGCADLISNFTAIKDWQLAHRLKNESYSESAASLSIMSAKMITDNVDSIKPGLEESARLVVKTLFSSGIYKVLQAPAVLLVDQNTHFPMLWIKF